MGLDHPEKIDVSDGYRTDSDEKDDWAAQDASHVESGMEIALASSAFAQVTDHTIIRTLTLLSHPFESICCSGGLRDLSGQRTADRVEVMLLRGVVYRHLSTLRTLIFH
jgi:hypothetical protein